MGKEGTDSISSQEWRWKQIIEKWELAAKEKKEILALGDLNLNTLRWDIPYESKNTYEKFQDKMVQLFKEKILHKGFKILNSHPTREKETIDQKPACLDLMITNKHEKISSFQSGISNFSDHTIQILNRTAKIIKSPPKYLNIRSYKNFNRIDYKANIINHHEYIEVFHEQDPNIITKKLQNIIKDSIDQMAPMIRIQTSEKTLTKFHKI